MLSDLGLELEVDFDCDDDRDDDDILSGFVPCYKNVQTFIFRKWISIFDVMPNIIKLGLVEVTYLFRVWS